MAFQITPKLINVYDWSEYDIKPWTQDVLLKEITRPNAELPRYLLLYKDNEFVVLDNLGQVVLKKQVSYTIGVARINNNGQVLVWSGNTIRLYDINGELLFSKTINGEIDDVEIGNEYFWIAFHAGDYFYVTSYRISDFTKWEHAMINADIYYVDLSCSESGYYCLLAYHYEYPAYHIVVYYSFGARLFSKGIYWRDRSYRGCSRMRPDGALALFGGYYPYEYARSWLAVIRRDGVHTIIYERWYSGDSRYQVGTNASFTSIAFVHGASNTIIRKEFDPNTMGYVDLDPIYLPENAEASPYYTIEWGDMTPDGYYMLVQSPSKIYIVDMVEGVVKKAITKGITGRPFKMIPSYV